MPHKYRGGEERTVTKGRILHQYHYIELTVVLKMYKKAKIKMKEKNYTFVSHFIGTSPLDHL